MERSHEVSASAGSLLLSPGKRDGCSEDSVLEIDRGSGPPGTSHGSEPCALLCAPGRARFPLLLPAVSRLFPAFSHLAHHGLATQVEQTFIFLRFSLCIPTTPLPATQVAPLQLPAPLISMVTADTAIIRILPQRVGRYKQAFLG